jgi:hypothetical protein
VNGTAANAPSNMKGQASNEARCRVVYWTGSRCPSQHLTQLAKQKLFQLIGRGHGEWLHKNAKVSIEKFANQITSTSDYGTFSVVIRDLSRYR